MSLTGAYRGGHNGQNGWFLSFTYTREDVEALKHAVPHTERAWNPITRQWFVLGSEENVAAVLRIFPAFEIYLQQPALFEVES